MPAKDPDVIRISPCICPGVSREYGQNGFQWREQRQAKGTVDVTPPHMPKCGPARGACGDSQSHSAIVGVLWRCGGLSRPGRRHVRIIFVHCEGAVVVTTQTSTTPGPVASLLVPGPFASFGRWPWMKLSTLHVRRTHTVPAITHSFSRYELPSLF